MSRKAWEGAEDDILVLHGVLALLEGHKGMGTNAPESMGLKITFGNPLHITLERSRTQRLRDSFKFWVKDENKRWFGR